MGGERFSPRTARRGSRLQFSCIILLSSPAHPLSVSGCFAVSLSTDIHLRLDSSQDAWSACCCLSPSNDSCSEDLDAAPLAPDHRRCSRRDS